uniref:SCP domain-containing protein n=1 Tax=Macrostomum lignano TaxID=282301 RepID=A0A1I8I925_9PLAT
MQHQAHIFCCLLTVFNCCLSPVLASISEKDKLAFVVTHNRLRQAIFPTARAMLLLEWNQSIADFASQISQHCNLSVNISKLYPKLDGHDFNMYKGSKATASPENVILHWYAEKSHFNISQQDNWIPKPGCSTRNYSNMMRQSQSVIGCGFTDCKDSTRMVVCGYSKAAGIAFENQFGCSCSDCPAKFSACFGEGSSIEACKECESMKSSKCLNSGVNYLAFVFPAKVHCGCLCPLEFVGKYCEISAILHVNSVKLTFVSAAWFRSGPLVVLPPIAKAQFHMEIWNLKFRSAVAEAVTKFCRNHYNYELCCSGRSYTVEVGSASYVGPEDVNYLQGTINQVAGGGLQLLIYIGVPAGSSTLCSVGKLKVQKRKLLLDRAQPAKFVRSAVIRLAVQQYKREIDESLPQGVAIGAIDFLESRADFGKDYGWIWTSYAARSSRNDVDNSNITDCIDRKSDITEKSYSSRLKVAPFINFITALLSVLLTK